MEKITKNSYKIGSLVVLKNGTTGTVIEKSRYNMATVGTEDENGNKIETRGRVVEVIE